MAKTGLRIASLLPSATEIVYALGLGDSLVAVTHECDFPPQAASRPAVTSNLLPPDLSPDQIDRAVRESQRDAHSIYALDLDELANLSPDVVLTQSLCEVCAVPRSEVEAAVCSMPHRAQVVSLDPHTLDEVLQCIREVGECLDVTERAERLTERLRARLDAVRAATSRVSARPRVLCVEWTEPVYRSGHWVPEQVRLAGGRDGLGEEGEPSTRIAWDDVLSYEPEIIVVMPCGYDATTAAEQVPLLADMPGWDRTPAVLAGAVFAANGSAYFSRPGPRLVDGVELLARIVHPEVFDKPAPAGSTLRLVSAPSVPARFEPYS